MKNKKNIDEYFIIQEYMKGKSSLLIAKELNLSKPKILKILKENNVTRKRDRCNSLDINKNENNYYISRICPNCNKIVKTTSKNKTIACRNHFRKIKGTGLCKPCSLKLQTGNGNPFYGKKHTFETKKKISNSRKGKAKGKENSMALKKWRNKLSKKLKQKWKNGEMEHARKIMSDKMKETIRNKKIKSTIKSKAETKIYNSIKKLGYDVKQSYLVDTKVCDIFLPKLNLIIEYYGDYWHCNPKKYNGDYFNKKKNLPAKKIWEYDKNRLELIRTYGYNLEVVWESDFKNNNKLILAILNKYDSNNNFAPERS